jgi:hypothetical protein
MVMVVVAAAVTMVGADKNQQKAPAEAAKTMFLMAAGAERRRLWQQR